MWLCYISNLCNERLYQIYLIGKKSLNLLGCVFDLQVFVGAPPPVQFLWARLRLLTRMSILLALRSVSSFYRPAQGSASGGLPTKEPQGKDKTSVCLGWVHATHEARDYLAATYLSWGGNGSKRHHFNYVDPGFCSPRLDVVRRIVPCESYTHLGYT